MLQLIQSRVAQGQGSATTRDRVQKLTPVLAAVAALVLLAGPASAATTVRTSLTFVEGSPQQVGCTAVNGFCGTGQVVPFGQATETIEFGAGCAGACDLRTIELAGGSLVLAEIAGSGNEKPNPSGYGQFSAPLTDVVVGGTDLFAAATGTLTGSVQGAGRSTIITLSGSITLAR
jgi:hypothetical protein